MTGTNDSFTLKVHFSELGFDTVYSVEYQKCKTLDELRGFVVKSLGDYSKKLPLKYDLLDSRDVLISENYMQLYYPNIPNLFRVYVREVKE
jgi:hypothetical protein